jgi:hypothetical protein
MTFTIDTDNNISAFATAEEDLRRSAKSSTFIRTREKGAWQKAR